MARKFLVVGMNMGQMVEDVKLEVGGRAKFTSMEGLVVQFQPMMKSPSRWKRAK